MSQNELEPPMPAATASPRHDRNAAAILDAAARVLADRGASANMAEVAAAGGVSRDDLPSEVLFELFGGLLATAVKLVGERRLGLEETAAATTTLFLEGAARSSPKERSSSREPEGRQS